MGLFSRVSSFVRSAFKREPQLDVQQAAVRDELSDIDDDLRHVWDEIADTVDDESQYAFTVTDNGAELFRQGWMDDGLSGEDRANARDEYFDLMEAYDISRDEFDWHAWRDWYE